MELTPQDVINLQSLIHHDGWKTYMGLLNEATRIATLACSQVIAFPEQQAAHNQRVGFLQGIEKARSVVPDIITQETTPQ